MHFVRAYAVSSAPPSSTEQQDDADDTDADQKLRSTRLKDGEQLTTATYTLNLHNSTFLYLIRMKYPGLLQRHHTRSGFYPL